ncbi:MAG: type II toxin-antitoxin system VapC family toxin [Nocardioides sp.]
MIGYLESSAAAKLLTDEPETRALEDYLATFGPRDAVVSALLLETDLRRLAAREGLEQDMVTALLDGVRLLRMGRQVFQMAGLLPGPGLRSLDALHLATAMLDEVDVLITYDSRLTSAAAAVGVATVSPS